MYRTPGSPPEDPLLVVPGEGLRGIRVGEATWEDVVRVFGEDEAGISRYQSGEVFKVDYDNGPGLALASDRPSQAARPGTFDFEFGLLEAIRLNVYQRDLYTIGGLRWGATRAQVLDVFGVGDEYTPGCLRYTDRGIEVTITETLNLFSMVIFRARR